jgi:hypothetical protein
MHPGWPEFSAWKFDSKTTTWHTAITWVEIVGQIDRGRPFLFSWQWNDGLVHLMVARGYDDTAQLIAVDDPAPIQERCNPGGDASGPFGGDFQFIPYSEFLGSAADGYGYMHGADVYDISHR